MQPISNHVFAIFSRFGFLNFYVIHNDDVLTVVDTGYQDGDIDQLQSDLSDRGYALDQVQHILITHAHVDHVGGLAELQARTNATTYVHRLDAPIVRGEQMTSYANPDELGFFGKFALSRMAGGRASRPARVDVELEDGQVLNAILEGLQVIHLPGHSYGQCGFWLPAEQTLIGGDVLTNFPWGTGLPFRIASPDWTAVKESVQKVHDLAPKMICVGHGKPITGEKLKLLPSLAQS